MISNPIYIVGFSGCGKSSTARKIAALMHGTSIDLDREIEHKAKKSISEIFSESGEDVFRKMESETLHQLVVGDETIVATGGGCPCYFDNMNFMNQNGITVYLKAPATVLAQRVKHRKFARPLLANIPDEQLIFEIESQLSKRESVYSQAQIIFPAFGLNPYQLLQEIRKLKTN